MSTREQWAYARRAVTCGRCNGEIAAGAQILEILGQTWRKVRCERCAGESGPRVIAEQPTDAQAIRIDFDARISAMRGLVADWKHKQAGDR